MCVCVCEREREAMGGAAADVCRGNLKPCLTWGVDLFWSWSLAELMCAVSIPEPQIQGSVLKCPPSVHFPVSANFCTQSGLCVGVCVCVCVCAFKQGAL